MAGTPTAMDDLEEAIRGLRSCLIVTHLDFSKPPQRKLIIQIILADDGGGPKADYSSWLQTVEPHQGSVVSGSGGKGVAPRAVFRKFGAAHAADGLVLAKLTVERKQGGEVAPAKLERLLRRAWLEALGQSVPSLAELDLEASDAKQAKKLRDARLLAILRTSVAEFHAVPHADRVDPDFRRADLAGLNLDGAHVDGIIFDGANFAGSSLVKAWFWKPSARATSIKRARFDGADLSEALLDNLNCQGCSFVGAKMHATILGRFNGDQCDFSGIDGAGIKSRNVRLTDARFVGANLAGGNFYGSDLRGADFTAAVLADAHLDTCTFDERTRWPAEFAIPATLEWAGSGPDPRIVAALAAAAAGQPTPTDLAGFLDRLDGAIPPEKVAKAMAMLRAERFQLFSEVEPGAVVGVVRSQSSAETVYSCRLDSGGSYACCTANLNVCGGLRGSPCKHLLVLLIGLVQLGQLDPAEAHRWTQATRGRKATLDKDAMAETLLRYRGVEAGEVDWRPSETIPEDFYLA